MNGSQQPAKSTKSGQISAASCVTQDNTGLKNSELMMQIAEDRYDRLCLMSSSGYATQILLKGTKAMSGRWAVMHGGS